MEYLFTLEELESLRYYLETYICDYSINDFRKNPIWQKIEKRINEIKEGREKTND